MKVTPRLLIARVEVAKVAQLIGLSCKWHKLHVMLWFGACVGVWVESDKIVPKIRLSSKFGVCAGGNSENGAGNIFPVHYKECSLDDDNGDNDDDLGINLKSLPRDTCDHPCTSPHRYQVPGISKKLPMPTSMLTMQSHMRNRKSVVGTAKLVTVTFQNSALSCFILDETFEVLQ